MSLNPPHPATRFVSRFPEKDAPPEIVRDFLAQELVPHYGSHEAAAKVAAKWVVGSGRELRDYPVWRYVQVFGPEDAWIVYRKVRPRYLDEWMAEKGIKSKFLDYMLTSRGLKKLIMAVLCRMDR